MYILIKLTDGRSVSRFERLVSGSIDIVRASGIQDSEEFSIDQSYKKSNQHVSAQTKTSRSESKSRLADTSGFGGFLGSGLPGASDSQVNSQLR